MYARSAYSAEQEGIELSAQAGALVGRKKTLGDRIWRSLKKYWPYYVMLIPGIIWYIIFCYTPMYGVTLAFKNFKMKRGIMGSPWMDPLFGNFMEFFKSPYAMRLLRNTLIMSVTKMVWAKVAAVGLALVLNECKKSWYRRIVQTVSYMPHFLSWVVIYGIVYLFCSESQGYINKVIRATGGQTIPFLSSNDYFRPLIYISHIWKGTGYSTIIYLAAMTSIDVTLYEAAQVDGAGRLRRIWHITLPGIRSTFIMLTIISVGSILSAGFDQVYVFYNELVYQTGDIIDTYVYRAGLEEMRFGLSTAVGLFKNVIGFFLVWGTNRLAQRWEEGIW